MKIIQLLGYDYFSIRLLTPSTLTSLDHQSQRNTLMSFSTGGGVISEDKCLHPHVDLRVLMRQSRCRQYRQQEHVKKPSPVNNKPTLREIKSEHASSKRRYHPVPRRYNAQHYYSADKLLQKKTLCLLRGIVWEAVP